MPKPRRQRESKGALQAEWQLAYLRPYEVVASIERGRWPARLSADASADLIEDVGIRLGRARKGSHDRELAKAKNAAARMVAAVPTVVTTAIYLEAELLMSANPRLRAKRLQLQQLLTGSRRVAGILERERLQARSRPLRAAFRDAERIIRQAYEAAAEEARQRPARAATDADAPRRAILISLAWWWLEQGWTPTKHGDGCFLLVAGHLEKARLGKDRAFNTLLVRQCIAEASKRHAHGDMLRWAENSPDEIP